MLKLFGRTKELTVTFCERCSEVCDADCRRAALRQQANVQQLWMGLKV